MKNMKSIEEYYIEEYDVTVMPYLTMKEISMIADIVAMRKDKIEREQALIANVLVCCTNIFDDSEKEAEILYEDIVYSGFWDKLLSECPYIERGIKLIEDEVERRESVNTTLMGIISAITDVFDSLTDADENFDREKIQELAQQIIDAQQDNTEEVNKDDSKQ